MISRRKKILFLSQGESSFRERDREILSKEHDVRTFYTSVKNPIGISRVLKELPFCDIVYCWFASETAVIVMYLASLLGKRTIVVAGGYDVAQVPEIGYGLTLDKKRERMIRVGLQRADAVLAVSESTKREVLDISPEAAVETIYVGSVDIDTFRPGGQKDTDRILTVGAITEMNLKKKGLEYFAQASQCRKNKEFVIVGAKADQEAVDKLQSIGGDNLHLTGYVKKCELIRQMQRSKVYVQPSIHESFGVSVAEAMACECVPVVSRNGALPEVVGDTGIYLSNLNSEEIANKIDEAMAISGASARERVADLFSTTRRENELLAAIDSL